MARQALQQSVESAAIALDAIWSNKLRSFMTVLGNIVAVTSIIAVVSLIRGLNASVQDAILTGVGADSFTIERTGVTMTEQEEEEVRSNPDITLADATAVRRSSSLATAVMARARRVGSVSYGEKSIDDVSVQGVTPEYIDFSAYDAERGRLMSPIEVERSRPIVVLGWQTADRLFGGNDPLDKIVRIEGVHFRVVGVSAKKGSFFGASQDAFAIIPLGCYQMLYGARQSLMLMVKPRDPSLLDAAMQEATAALRAGRRLKPRQLDNFGMFTSDTFLSLYHQATNGIFAVLVGVVALSLVVGGIVIMNIMLMVVIERTREIGLRKALGARRQDIVWQILIESIVLSTCGGAVGTMFGFLVALTVASLTPVPAAVEPWSVVLGLSITALVGLFFGLYPAVRAARLDPIEALRRE
jgi:putative ABC transport system permease protein